MAPAVILAASLIVGGVGDSLSPRSTPQAVEAVAPTTTSTTLTTNPVASAPLSNPVTLTARVTPATAAGSVQFMDGSAALGTAVPMDNGIAVATPTLLPGPHSLTAMFVPANATAFASSSSPQPVTFMVGAAETNTTLTTTPASAIAEGDLVTLNAMLTPANAAGTVQFIDGTVPLGGPQPVTNGVAAGSTSRLREGSHALVAVFTPTSSSSFNPSMSSVTYLTVTRSGTESRVILDSQDSGLSLDLGLLDGQAPARDAGQGTLDGRRETFTDLRPLLDGHLSALGDRPLLDVVLEAR